MVTFRDLEKEYKQKKLSKSAYQNHNEIEGKFLFDSNEDDSVEDGDSDSDEGHRSSSRPNMDYFDDSDGELPSEDERQRPNMQMRKHFAEDDDLDLSPVDKEALILTIGTELKEAQAKHEAEINSMRNMKKGSVKKNKDRIAVLMSRINNNKQVREQIDELNIGLDYIDQKRMRTMRHLSQQFLKDQEDESLREGLLGEVENLIE